MTRAKRKNAPPLSFITIASVGCGCIALSFVAGTSLFNFPQGSSASAQDSSLHSIREVQHCPQYLHAETLYHKKQYSAAATKLTKLENSRPFSRSQIKYIQKKRELCIAHLMHIGRVTMPLPLPVPESMPDCGLRALVLALHYLGMPVDLDALEQESPGTGKGSGMKALASIAGRYGLNPQCVNIDINGLASLKTPAISVDDDNHYIAIYSLQNNSAVIHDPTMTGATTTSQKDLLKMTGGHFLELGK